MNIFYEYTNIEFFKYAGIFVFWCSILLFLPSIVGWIIATIAFLKMHDNLKLVN